MTTILLVTHTAHWTNYLLVRFSQTSFTSGRSFGFFSQLKLLIASLILLKIIGVRVYSQIQLALSLFYRSIRWHNIQVFFSCGG